MRFSKTAMLTMSLSILLGQKLTQAANIPVPGSKRTRLAFRLSARAGSTGSDSDRKTYAPDAGWYIVNVKYKVKSKFGIASFSHGYQRANSSFASSSEAKEAYKSAYDAAGRKGQTRYQGAIKQEMNTFQQYRNMVKASHGTLYGTAKARGRGLTQGGSSVNVDYYVTEVYVGTKTGLRNRSRYWLAKINGGPSSSNSKTSSIRYTIWNSTKRTVRFRLPTGKQYSLAPGKTGQYRNTGKNLKIQVLNTGKTYRLSSGKHKFWTMKNRRIGFDRNYR